MEIKLKRVSSKFFLPVASAVTLVLALGAIFVTVASTPKVVPVLVASVAIAEGEPLTPDSVKLQAMAIGEVADLYLYEFSDNLTTTRTFQPGEPISKSGLTNLFDRRTPMRINGLAPFSKAITVGDKVDVWASSAGQLSVSPPQPVVFEAIVVAIEESSTLSQPTTSVELRIPIEYLESLLAALEPSSRISLILHETLSDLG
jgi:Flp pilus assembly protein CpaB